MPRNFANDEKTPTSDTFDGDDDSFDNDGENETYEQLLSGKQHAKGDKLSQNTDGHQNTHQLIKNSPFLTVFLLVNSMIGSGILNQPYVFMKSGILGGLLGFLVGIIGTWGCALLLTESGINCNILEYGSLAHKAMGQIGNKMVDYSIILLALGAQLGYIIVIGETSSQVLSNWGCTESLPCSQFYVTIWLVVFFVTPLCLFRTFGHLAFLSVFSIIAILLCILLVVFAGPMVSQYDYKDPITLFNLQGSIMSTGSIVLALNCASVNFHAYVSTDEKSKGIDSWVAMTGSATFIGAIMCILMGICGYWAFREETNGQILNNFVGRNFDFFKVMIVAHLILYIPIQFVVMRYSLVKQFSKDGHTKSEDMSWKHHFILTLFLLSLMTGVVLILVYTDNASGTAFALITDIVGGISGSMLTFILPSLIYINTPPVLIASRRTVYHSVDTHNSAEHAYNNNSPSKSVLYSAETATYAKLTPRQRNLKLLFRHQCMTVLAYFNLIVGIIVLITVVSVTFYSNLM